MGHPSCFNHWNFQFNSQSISFTFPIVSTYFGTDLINIHKTSKQDSSNLKLVYICTLFYTHITYFRYFNQGSRDLKQMECRIRYNDRANTGEGMLKTNN